MRGVVNATLLALCVLGVISCTTAPRYSTFLKSKAVTPKQYKIIWTQSSVNTNLYAYLSQGLEASTNGGKSWFVYTNFVFCSGTNVVPLDTTKYKSCMFRAYWKFN